MVGFMDGHEPFLMATTIDHLLSWHLRHLGCNRCHDKRWSIVVAFFNSVTISPVGPICYWQHIVLSGAARFDTGVKFCGPTL